MLVQPVRHQPADARGPATTPRGGCRRPTRRRCSSRRSCRGRRRSSRSARPRRTSARSAATTTRGTARCTPRTRRPARAAARSSPVVVARGARRCARGLRRRVVGVDLVAEEHARSGHSSTGWSSIRMAWAWSASTPRPRSSSASCSDHGGSCGAAARHEPNRTRIGGSPLRHAGARSATRSAGAPRSGIGQAIVAVEAHVVRQAVARPQAARRRRARSGGRRRRTSARSWPSTVTVHGPSVSTQIVAVVSVT